MAKRPNADPILLELQRELQTTQQALKDAYLRFDCACDSDLVEACIYEINALKARSNYILRRIKARSGEKVSSAVPHAVPVVKVPETEEDCVAAANMKGGPVCPS